uniref:Retrotransposon gag domain-containing protein n=1 Tax=Sinocyclocheilus anshuiensis TaxID=1608454 RepID=A0A671R8I4_9TELE
MAEDKLRGLRQVGQKLEQYVEDFLELANQLSWHDAALGACFQLGLDGETIRCDLPVCNYPLIELIDLVLYLNGSNHEVEEIKEKFQSRRTPTYRTNGSNHPQLSPGRAPDSSFSPGRAPDPQLSPGRAPDSSFSPGRAPGSSFSPGRAPDPQFLPGRAPDPQFLPGRAPDPQSSPGRAPDPQVSPGRAPDPHPMFTGNQSA